MSDCQLVNPVLGLRICDNSKYTEPSYTEFTVFGIVYVLSVTTHFGTSNFYRPEVCETGQNGGHVLYTAYRCTFKYAHISLIKRLAVWQYCPARIFDPSARLFASWHAIWRIGSRRSVSTYENRIFFKRRANSLLVMGFEWEFCENKIT